MTVFVKFCIRSKWMIPMGNDVMGLAEDSENHLQIF